MLSKRIPLGIRLGENAVSALSLEHDVMWGL